MAPKLTATGDMTMRTTITLPSLGLALALSGAALANPVDRPDVLAQTVYADEKMQIHYWHKRYPHDRLDRAGRLHDRLYRDNQTHPRGTGRLQDPSDGPAIGTGRPEVGKPALRPVPPLWREPKIGQRAQI